MNENKEEAQNYNNDLISVIVPVYNVRTYLKKCLDSIKAQTYRNLEIILVDDGSTDGSGEICDEYARDDSRFMVIHKANGGLSDARNSALDMVNGEFITFVDSDDYISDKYIEALYGYAIKESCDLVVGSHLKVVGDKNEYKNQKNSCNIYTSREMMLALLYGRVSTYCHGKLYRSYLFNKLRFPSGKLFEDVITIWNVAKQVNKVGCINLKLYFYRQHEDSIVQAAYSHRRMDQVYWVLDILGDTANDKELHKAAISKYFFVLADNYALISNNHIKDKKFLEKEIKKCRKTVLLDNNNKKLLRILALISYLPIEAVRIVGKGYKRYLNLSYKLNGKKS